MLGIVIVAVREKGITVGAVTPAVNGMPDHLHVAVRLPATVTVAKYVEEVKGYAAYLVNHSASTPAHLYWQSGYGAVTFRKSDLPTVVRYIERQQEQHGGQDLWRDFEKCRDE